MLGREKSKEPYVDEDEMEIDCQLYIFDEMFDLDEFYYCDYCGGWLSKYVYEHKSCEC